jgi:MYXO-CTERM domain-containing protein
MTRLLLAAAVFVSVAFAPAAASAQDALTVSFTTTTIAGEYAPRNVVAVWVEDSAGNFVKTISRHAAIRTQHLVAWVQSAGAGDTDAVSGATRLDHAASLMASWDFTDRQNQPVPNGVYTIRMESAEDNSTTANQNNQGTFTVDKNGTASMQTVANGGFENVVIDYAPGVNNANCDNGMVDSGETCDPPGSCPTDCQASGDACVLNQLVGSAAQCTAECVQNTVTTCIDGDGCCAAGCSAVEDDDCSTGSGNGDTTTGPVVGGCSTSDASGGALAGWLLIFGLLALPRRRRRS